MLADPGWLKGEAQDPVRRSGSQQSQVRVSVPDHRTESIHSLNLKRDEQESSWLAVPEDSVAAWLKAEVEFIGAPLDSSLDYGAESQDRWPICVPWLERE